MSKIIRAPINPDILEWALKDLNLSPQDFAQKVKVKPEKVKEWLEGESVPTYIQLEKIAYKILKLPLASFFLSEVPRNLSIKKKFRTIPEYLLQATSYKTRIAIKRADFYRSALYELYKKNPSPISLFKLYKISLRNNPIKVSKELREKLLINYDKQKSFRNNYQAFNYYRDVLEQKGIFLFQLQLEGDRGFCLLDEEFPIIIVNSSDSISSKIFTLFHELVHILLNSDDIYKEVLPTLYQSDPVEIFCNYIASEILVPGEEFVEKNRDFLKSWDEQSISRIANDYSVSREVITLKMIFLGYAERKDYLMLKKKWDDEFRNKKQSGGDYYINKISALGKSYIFTVIDSYKKGFLNDLQVSNYLGMKFTNLPRIEAEVYA